MVSNKDKIWLSSPHMGENEITYVKSAFDSNWIAPIGPNIKIFEEKIKHYFNSKREIVALSSGTAAIHLALNLLNIGPNDIVFCQSLTFCASANPIIYQGATPIFIDSEFMTWNMDPLLLRNALYESKMNGKLPKAIIVVHLYGMPAKIEEILSIASEYNIPVIEDAAEALGSKIGSNLCGSFSNYAILSFNGNKIITTSSGGALLSENKNIIEKARFLSTQARDAAPHYQHSQIGYNYRMSNVLAGIGIGQMEELEKRILARRNNFNEYKNYFSKFNKVGFNFKFQEEISGYYSNRWLTCIIINPELNNGLTRFHISEALESENIESRPIWKPLHLQPVFSNYRAYLNGVSEELFNHGICLPSGSNLTSDQFKRIFDCLDKVLMQFTN